MIRHVFIIVPSDHPTGPVKGAYALANALVDERPVTLVTLREGPGASAPLDRRVLRRSLADVGSRWWNRLTTYRSMLREAGGRSHVGSISMCFSADMVNCWSAADAVTCASVRGNLMKNYRLDYGLPGMPLAVGHLAALRRADHIVAITTAMAAQIASYAGKAPIVIGNFIDEPALDVYRSSTRREGPLRFVFVGSLTTRKQPLVVLRAVRELKQRGLDVRLDVVGVGPLSKAVEDAVTSLSLQGLVTLHGHVAEPFSIVAASDAMVLPSLSEGIARSALEALHLGVPCLVRNVDGNAELIPTASHGALFDNDRELPEKMLAVAERSRGVTAARESLLPAGFRQREQARRYLRLLEGPL